MTEKKKANITIQDLNMVPATQAKNKFGDLLHRVCYEKDPILIEKNGRPMAVIMDIDLYMELKKRKPVQDDSDSPDSPAE